jgi:hypothetical protein
LGFAFPVSRFGEVSCSREGVELTGEGCQRTLKWTVLSTGCAVLLALAAPLAVAQGCAMCYQTAAASGASGREALRHGILILLLPAVSLFLGICGLIYLRRDQTR